MQYDKQEAELTDFEDDYEEAKIGEGYAQIILKKELNKTEEYNNVQYIDDIEEQKKLGFDFRCINNGKEETHEIKWSGTIAGPYHSIAGEYRCYSNRCYKYYDGWVYHTTADWLWYGDKVNMKFYIFNMNQLRQHIENNKNHYKKFTKKSKTGTAYCYEVPFNSVKYLVVKEVDILNYLK